MSILAASIILASVFLTAPASCASVSPGLYEFPNGFRLVHDKIKGTGLVSFGIWVGAGSVHEGDCLAGIAHMLEHMLFKGSAGRRPGEAERIMESLGARMNGATSFEYTCYYATVPSENFGKAFEVLADIVKRPLFCPEEFIREKKVVLRELGQREDDPARRSARMFYQAAFPGHFYGRPIIGYAGTVKELTLEELKTFYSRHYTPCNMTLVVCGDIPSHAVLRHAGRRFGGMRAAGAAPPAPPREISRGGKFVEYADIKSAYLWLGSKGPPASPEDVRAAAALSLASSVLGSGRSSRLYRVLRDDKNIVGSISAGFSFLPRGGPFFIRTVHEPGMTDEVKEAVYREIDSFLEEGPSESELERARRMAVSDIVFGLEPGAGRMRAYGNYAASGNMGFLLEYSRALGSVTAGEVRKAAEKYIVPENFVSAELLPAGRGGDAEY